MRLPGEDELRATIRRELATELQVASDLLNVGTSIFQRGVLPKPKEEIELLEVWMSLGIVAKACHQYRGIAAVAEISLGDVADNNGRMLMETMFAAHFLMRPTLVLMRDKVRVPDVPGYPLTPSFRARLYLSHDAASTLKILREMADHGEIGVADAQSVLAIAQKHMDEHLAEIGPEWAKRQKEGKSYSGLSVIDLAGSIGMRFIYHTFYRPSSAGVHGTDARKFVEPKERPDGGITFHACLNTAGVAEALVYSSLMMLGILDVANQRFGLGLEDRLNELGPRIQSMAQRLPNEQRSSSRNGVRGKDGKAEGTESRQ